MSVNLTQKDWLLISAYLDGRVNAAEKASFDSRLESDADFKSAYIEIQYTRRLLRSLPQKHAPRNFTLSAEYVKKTSPKWGLNRIFGLASAASAVALAAIFAWTNLFVFQARTSAPAPMMAAVPQTATDSMAVGSEAASTGDVSNAPMIITWGHTQADGMGGGGRDSSSLATGMGGGFGGGPAPQPKMVTAVPTESPMISSEQIATPDPSTLILGLPEPGTEGETVQQSTPEALVYSPPLPASTLWMIGLGAVALIFAALAFFLRKR